VRDHTHFERKLYVIAALREAVVALDIPEKPSLHGRAQLEHAHLQGHAERRPDRDGMYPDLTDPRVESALALVHQRLQHEHFPSWPSRTRTGTSRHNGEINTRRATSTGGGPARRSAVRGPRETSRRCCRSPATGCPDSRPSGQRALVVVMNGRSLPHAILMMIPTVAEPRGDEPGAAGLLRVSRLTDGAVDGPASIAFTDGP